MQKLPLPVKRASAAAFCCFALAALLGGCASKNPLMEEPTPAKSSAAAPDAKAPAGAEAKPAAPAAAQATAQADDTGGVRVIQHKKPFLGIFTPYRPDIQQGNFVSKEMVAQLQVGMTPDQVIFLMGTPLLTDIFHANRWDYLFWLQKGNGPTTTSRVTIYFKDNRVARIEGAGNLPTEADYLARIANKAKQAKKQ